MSKTYDYKTLIDVYIRIPLQDGIHEDFRNYREALVDKLEILLGTPLKFDDIPINSNEFPYGRFELFPLWKLFEHIVSLLRISYSSGVTGSWLEGGPEVSLLRMRHQNNEDERINLAEDTINKLKELTEQIDEQRLNLLYTLFELFYGRIDKVVSSEDLMAVGFDDSKEPKISDYYDYF